MSEQKQLLLVDDDSNFNRVMARAFKQREFNVNTALDAEQAIEAARQNPPSHVILDLNMPGASGLNIIAPLLEISPLARIIVLTGYSSIATSVEAIKLGAINYLCKPATANEILAAFSETDGDGLAAPATKPPSVDRLEWEHIQKILLQNDGNISATARALGMHRRTLQRKLQKKPVKH